jgi:hypothetical protein
MNIRRLFLALVIVGLLLGGWKWWRSTMPATSPAPKSATGASVPLLEPVSKLARAAIVLATLNHVPVDFYGKLVDQFGQPVAGASIKASIRVNNGVTATTDWLTTTSDANGLFEFHGRGEDIGMMPRKAGYALASTETYFKYSHLEDHPYVSDAGKPKVINMWKLQGAEPLSIIKKQFHIPYTGEAIHFDLLTEKIVPTGGDITITVNRPPGTISGHNHQDWSLKIEAVDGGLIETGQEEHVTYFAPESGYESAASYTMSDKTHNFFQGVIRSYLFTSRNHQVYGKIDFSFTLNGDPSEPMGVQFRGVANANSSRNLEADPNSMNAIVN